MLWKRKGRYTISPSENGMKGTRIGLRQEHRQFFHQEKGRPGMGMDAWTQADLDVGRKEKLPGSFSFSKWKSAAERKKKAIFHLLRHLVVNLQSILWFSLKVFVTNVQYDHWCDCLMTISSMTLWTSWGQEPLIHHWITSIWHLSVF